MLNNFSLATTLFASESSHILLQVCFKMILVQRRRSSIMGFDWSCNGQTMHLPKWPIKLSKKIQEASRQVDPPPLRFLIPDVFMFFSLRNKFITSLIAEAANCFRRWSLRWRQRLRWRHRLRWRRSRRRRQSCRGWRNRRGWLKTQVMVIKGPLKSTTVPPTTLQSTKIVTNGPILCERGSRHCYGPVTRSLFFHLQRRRK